MTSATFSQSLVVPADHACFAGHFPGNPILPGVLLLESVVSYASQQFSCSAAACVLQNVKFAAPVLPGDQIDIQLISREPGDCKFTVHAVRPDTAGVLVCSGQLRMAVLPSSAI
jgi:3-hydroxyacyl-[acyl-carrier-protein] dehydratase